jgi:hypothetical protein
VDALPSAYDLQFLILRKITPDILPQMGGAAAAGNATAAAAAAPVATAAANTATEAKTGGAGAALKKLFGRENFGVRFSLPRRFSGA